MLVVLGAYELAASARTIHCPDWQRGPGASLRCGLARLAPDVDAAVVILADGPELSPQAIDRVVEAWSETGEEVVAASYGGVRGHPVLLSRAVWELIPDRGARELPAVLVPCDDLGPPGDVDFADELPERLRQPTAEE